MPREKHTKDLGISIRHQIIPESCFIYSKQRNVITLQDYSMEII